MNIARKRIIIRGVVQGVGYRFFARRHAERIGVRGFVANCDDGSVLVEAEGFPDQLADYIAILREGPASGDVADLRAEDIPPENSRGFVITN